MIPGNELSSETVPRDFAYEPVQRTSLLVDYEMGGVALNDPSQGMLVRLWTAEVRFGSRIYILAEGVEESLQYIATAIITEINFTFDQNMRPFIAMVEGGVAKFLWFDPVESQQVKTELPAFSRDPRCSLDDKRSFALSTSDIILAYVRNNNLYFRLQRDRYLVEYLLKEGVIGSLLFIGMNEGQRFQFEFGIRMTYQEFLDSRTGNGEPVDLIPEELNSEVSLVGDSTVWEPIEEE